MTLASRKSKISNSTLAWMAFAGWLSYSLVALWVLEKENLQIGTICSVAVNKSN